jgi:uncharacterized protein DUF6065
MRLTAFPTSAPGTALVGIVPAPRWREWMNTTRNRFAQPMPALLMANEASWVLLNPVAFDAVRDGASERSAATISFDDGVQRFPLVESLVGEGNLTSTIPYLFSTPPGYNLLGRVLLTGRKMVSVRSRPHRNRLGHGAPSR